MPERKHNYCAVCNEHFEDGKFREHVNSDAHSSCVKREPFYDNIDSIINELNKSFDEQNKLNSMQQ